MGYSPWGCKESDMTDAGVEGLLLLLLLLFSVPFIFFYFTLQHCIGFAIHQHESAIKNNTFESVLMRWMKLEPII